MAFALPDNRDAAVRWYGRVQRQLSPAQWREAQRWLGRNDLFFLLTVLLRRPEANNSWLFERCREVQAAPNGHLDLWARGHYKSTIITFALTIQDILNDPEITIGIFSHTRPIAKKFLSQIKSEFEQNTWLKHLYPDVLYEFPERQSPKWSEDDGITVKRKGNPKESTVEANGLVDGMPTGRHYRMMVYDDVVEERSVTTGEQIAKTTKAWELSNNLGIPKDKGGVVRYIGTRYNLADTYSVMLDRMSAIPRIHPATHNGRFDGKPVFFSQATWEEKVRDQGPTTSAAQLLQNPQADELAAFKTIWLEAYEVRPRTLNVYIMGDPSRGRTATSDDTSIVVIGIASEGKKFLLDGSCHKMTLSQRWHRLRELYHRWSSMPGVQRVECGWERFGAQSDDEYFEEQMRLDHRNGVRNAHFTIEELSWPREGGASKRARIERLEPDFRLGKFLIPSQVMIDGKAHTWKVNSDIDKRDFGKVVFKSGGELTKRQMDAFKAGSNDLISRPLIDRDPAIASARPGGARYDLTVKFLHDYEMFPFGKHDDLLDSISRIYDMDPTPPLAPTRRRMTDPRVYADGV